MLHVEFIKVLLAGGGSNAAEYVDVRNSRLVVF